MPHDRSADDRHGHRATAHEAELAIAEIASRQHGVVHAAQLAANGVSARMVHTRARAGVLHALHRSVYLVAPAEATKEARMMAAVLACAPDAVISHRSAGGLWEIRRSSVPVVDVTTPARRRRPGIRAHCGQLDPADVTSHRGIPCTTIPKTLIDLGESLRPAAVEYALHQAQARDLIDPAALAAALERSAGHRGAGILRGLLGPAFDDEVRTKSRLERRFLRICREARLPTPAVNAWIPLPIAAGGLEVDFTWRERMVAVETDSARFHGTLRAQRHDAERDRALLLAGWRVLRYTWHDLFDRPGAVAAELAEVLSIPRHVAG